MKIGLFSICPDIDVDPALQITRSAQSYNLSIEFEYVITVESIEYFKGVDSHGCLFKKHFVR